MPRIRRRRWQAARGSLRPMNRRAGCDRRPARPKPSSPGAAAPLDETATSSPPTPDCISGQTPAPRSDRPISWPPEPRPPHDARNHRAPERWSRHQPTRRVTPINQARAGHHGEDQRQLHRSAGWHPSPPGVLRAGQSCPLLLPRSTGQPVRLAGRAMRHDGFTIFSRTSLSRIGPWTWHAGLKLPYRQRPGTSAREGAIREFHRLAASRRFGNTRMRNQATI